MWGCTTAIILAMNTNHSELFDFKCGWQMVMLYNFTPSCKFEFKRPQQLLCANLFYATKSVFINQQ